MKKRLLFYPLFLIAFISFILWMKHMPGTSYQGKSPQLTEEQKKLGELYKTQVNTYAKEARSFLHPQNLERTEKFIIDYLKSHENKGNAINEQVYLYKYKNIELVIEPKEKAIQTIVIGAHYDSAEHAPGADDNFSSVVILLELAKRFNQKFEAKNTRLRIVFFTNEEPPFFKTDDMGSAVYTAMLSKNKENVVGMYAFDMLGFFSEEDNTQHYPLMFAPFFPDKGNFVGFIGNIASRDLIQKSVGAFRENAQFPSEGVSAPSYITGIDFSDHSAFYYYKWPALMVSDTAFYRNTHYHKDTDTPDKLNYEKMSLLTDHLEKMFRKLYEK